MLKVSLLSSAMVSCLMVTSGCMVTIGRPYTTPLATGGSIVERSVTLDSDNGEFPTLSIITPRGTDSVTVSHGGTQVTVTARFSSDSESALNEFAHASSHYIANGELTLHIGAPYYQCLQHTFNGVRTVSGVCIDGLNINLPRNSRTRISVNGLPVGLQGAMLLSDLSRALRMRSSFEDDQIIAIEAFIESNRDRARFITVADAVSILRAMSYEGGKLEAARRLSGHILDQLNASLATPGMSFEDNQAEVVRLLRL